MFANLGYFIGFFEGLCFYKLFMLFLEIVSEDYLNK